LRKKSLACPSDLSWREKINKMDMISLQNVSRGIPHATEERDDGYFCANPSLTTNRNKSSSNGGTSPFKVQINFDIPIFEGHIDTNVVYKWLNLI
jgi:hypothetical protein